MSETFTTALSVDPLPVLPETSPPDPIVQCGVLYLGTGPTGAGLRALDSIQEPFSHRYPVDGTNKVRGIDAVLSIYDNGVQLAFTRQPHSVLFFPISALIYCSSVRFTVVENDETKPSSPIDWRFMPLDTIGNYENKHPPLFCAVVRRTQFLPGEECHCFITKSPDAAIALVQAISQIYANIRPRTSCLKAPIFYQLDRYGRKLSEITGVIYISPANDDDPPLNRKNANRITDETIARKYLFDPSYDGFFYRTDISLIEQWQLWDDDDDLNHTRPRPPASPFGLHEGLYHDDTTNEIHRYLRHMDEEHSSCSCSSSISSRSSCSTKSSISTEYSRKKIRYRSNKVKATEDTDQFNLSLSNLQNSSFEPVLPRKNVELKKRPIIIEKVLPKSIPAIPILHPQLPPQLFDPIPELQIDCHQEPDTSSLEYQINERGEKITKEGNRIVFMDVVQMNTNGNAIESPSYRPSKTRLRSHRHRIFKQVPIIDMQSIERLFNEKNSTNHRRANISTDNPSKEQPRNTDQSEILDRYFADYHQTRSKASNPTNQSVSNQTESTDRTKQQQKTSITSSTHSSKSETRRQRHPQPTMTTGPAINYVERSLIPPLTPNQFVSTMPQHSPLPPVLTDAKLNEYITNIYGTARSIHSTSSSTSHQGNKSSEKTAVDNPTYISAFRYMQSSLNRNILEEYRNAY